MFELEGTGLVDTYYELIRDVIGPKLFDELGQIAREALVFPPGSIDRKQKFDQSLLPPSAFWPVIAELVSMFYLGTWQQLPDSWYASVGLPIPEAGEPGQTHVPSSLAYIEQLSYRTASAHPPGAKPTGFGSWAQPPIGI